MLPRGGGTTLFTDRKQENQSLQKESKRTGVYGQKVEELKFTDRKQKTRSLHGVNLKLNPDIINHEVNLNLNPDINIE